MTVRQIPFRKAPLYIACAGIFIAGASLSWFGGAGAIHDNIVQHLIEQRLKNFASECSERWPSRALQLRVVEKGGYLDFDMQCLIEANGEFIPEEDIPVN